MDLDALADRAKPTLVVVHSPRVASAEPPKRAGRVLPRSSDARDPRNYLMSGGARALDKDREREKAAAAREKVKELKTASSALAGELLRTRQESEREICTLRDDMAELAGRFKAEQERIVLLKERLAEEGRVRGELEAAHKERVRDLHRRLQAEHLLRVNAEADLAKAQDKAATAAAAIKGAEAELAGALQEVGSLQESKLEAELALNKERRQHAEAQGVLESLRLSHERERSSREHAQRRVAELEGTVAGLTERNSSLFDDLKAAEAALKAAKDAKSHADGTVAHHKEEIRVLHEQLESQKKCKAAAVEESRRLQQRVAELEAGAAVYIAKEAHYDDLHEEYEVARGALQRSQADLERAKGDIKTLLEKLDAATSKASSLDTTLRQRDSEAAALRDQLSKTAAEHRSALATLQRQVAAAEERAGEASREASAAAAAAREREGAVSKAQAELAELGASLEGLRRGREEMGRAMQDKDSYIESLRCEVRALGEELGTAQRRARGMQADADAAELELSRRDLKIKELSDAVHVLSTKLSDEQAAAAGEKRRMEGVIRSLESRASQGTSELGAARQEVAALQQAKTAASAELAAAQEECAHLRSQLGEEQARCSKLRGELACVSSSHMKEVESKGQAVADVMGRLQAEETARVTAEHEMRALKRRLEEMEASLAEAQAAQARTQEAYDHSQAALDSMKRKLQVYKKENKSLMSSYDDWLKTMVKTRPGALSGGQ